MFSFDTAGATHTGKVRHNNEDSFVICKSNTPLAVVADGIGGHANGEVASLMCCNGMEENFKSSPPAVNISSERAGKLLKKYVCDINSRIFERNKQEKHPLPMGSTLCAAMFFQEFIICANVGDSRLYFLENGKIRSVTRDHTVVHNGGHYLSRAMGVIPQVEPDIFTLVHPAADRYILMSDGVYNSLAEEKISVLLDKAATAQEAAESIIEQANKNGGVDNLTVIAVIRKNS